MSCLCTSKSTSSIGSALLQAMTGMHCYSWQTNGASQSNTGAQIKKICGVYSKLSDQFFIGKALYYKTYIFQAKAYDLTSIKFLWRN